MVRTILTPEHTHIELDIPAEYVGKKIEIICFSLNELEPPQAKKSMSDFWGTLSDQTSDDLRKHIQDSRNEWERYI